MSAAAGLTAVQPAGFPAPESGAEIALCIRPESLRFTEPPAGAPNVLRGTLRDTVYLGEVAQHRFAVGGDAGADLKAFEFNPRRIARDEAVAAAAWVEPQDVVPLRA